MSNKRRLIGIVSVLLCVGLIGFFRTQGAQAKAGSCTVTSGANKGKTGTYTTEEGNGATWCEGSGFATECTKDAKGVSKCKDAAKLETGGGGGGKVFTAADKAILQGLVVATDPGAKRGAAEAWSQKYNARVVSRSGTAVTVALPDKTVTIDGNLKALVGTSR